MFPRTLIVALLFAACSCSQDRPLVKTPLGIVQGHLKTSHGGKKFAAFEGIPYAKPPVGDRRFEEPEPIGPWKGIWNATYLTECSQTVMLQPHLTQGSEDCLHIDVYVPRQNPDPSENLDVIVHIHGGAYMYGSGHLYSHPEFLLDREVIYVTFNYRVGILGFLSTEDDVVFGNNGLKDQVLALKWVQSNIKSFGGNPDSVTLTGASAGASGVHFHYFSDMSKGLFHRGFSQSGVTLNAFSLQKGALSKAQRLGEGVGCPSNPSKVLVKCLKERPVEQILDQLASFYEFGSAPAVPFAPVVEKGSKPFLKEHPYYLLTKGEVLDVPWIASNTAHEGLLLFTYFAMDKFELDKNWETWAPFVIDFNYTLPKSLWKSTSKKIKDFYLGRDQDLSLENMDKFIQLFTDRIFVTDAEIAVRLQAKATKSPIYYYYFTYPGDNEAKTVNHGDDTKYFFGNMFKQYPLGNNELKMKDVMIDMLMSYVKTGVPAFNGVKWEATKDDKLTYLSINGFEDGEIELKTVDELTPIQFWKSLGFLENGNLISVKDEL